MIFTEANSEQLIIIQDALRDSSMRYLLRHFDPQKVKPVPVIYYPIDKTRVYLMGDGHNRAAMRYMQGPQIPIQLLETDEEVERCLDGAFNGHSKKSSFIDVYEKTWKKECEESQVFSIADLVVKYHLEQLKSTFDEAYRKQKWLDEIKLEERICRVFPD